MANPKQQITTIGKKLFELKRERDMLEAKVKKLNFEIEQIATGRLAELMTESEMEKFTLTGYGTIYMKDEFYCNVLKENRDDLYAWLRKTGNEDLITDWVQPSTFKAFVKDQLERGNLTIPDYVKMRHVPTANTMSTMSKK